MPEKTFKCLRCGNCCRMPGYVRVTEGEIRRIAQFLGEDPAKFREEWTAPTHDNDRRTLLENPDGGCVYLDDENACIINPVKPLQCREFPERWRYKNMEHVCQAVAQKEHVPSTERSR